MAISRVSKRNAESKARAIAIYDAVGAFYEYNKIDDGDLCSEITKQRIGQILGDTYYALLQTYDAGRETKN
jgi:hypothetical protein